MVAERRRGAERWTRMVAIAGFALLAACGGADGVGAPTTTSTPTPSTTRVEPSASSTTTTLPASVVVQRLAVAGPEEVVYDWTTDRCEDDHIPDISTRAYRDADGLVSLTIGHWNNYRMVGPSLDEVRTDCDEIVLSSSFDPDPAAFNDSEWLAATYTTDGETVYGVVHNEYRGDTHGAARPGQCPSGQRLPCLDTSVTMVVSTDGGATFDDLVEPPGHVIATLPYRYVDDSVPSGLRQPSNLIEGPDGYIYLFTNISSQPVEEQWVCVMRTDDLDDPGSWRYWDGAGFDGEFLDPYRTDLGLGSDTCAPLAGDQLAAEVNETIVFDEVLERFVMMGITFHPSAGEPRWGVYYSTSADLIEWSTRRLLLDVPVNGSVEDKDNDLVHAYPSAIDPDSASLNFSTTDGGFYLYLSRFNAGGNSVDRDLLRWPVEVVDVELTAPEWDFATDGDAGGWHALNAVTDPVASGGVLVVESTGDDPHFASGPVEIPAVYDRLAVRMQVSGDGERVQGQLFFGTDTEPIHTEPGSILFETIADGEFHDYELDLSTVALWSGTVISLRLDPVPDAGRRMEIDRIWFPGL